MKFDKWTVGLATAGVVSLGSAAVADESPVNTLLSGTTLSGYVDTSMIYKPGVQSAAYRFANTAPDTWNGFNFNVVDLTIQKALDEDKWSAGYRADLWFGPQAAGLPGAFGANGTLGDNFGVKQAYVALRAPVGNGLDFKVGQIDTIIGYEVLDSYANPTFSRSLGFNIEPFSHTGMTATYQVAEWLSVVGGVADSAFNGTNQKETYNGQNNDGTITSNGGSGNGTLTYMGAVTLKAPESWGSLAGAALYGGIVSNGRSGYTYTDGDFGMGIQENSLNYYVGVSVPTPIKEITVGAAWDYLSDGNGDGTWATAVAGYVSWQISEKLKLNTRAEWAKSDYNAWAIGPALGATTVAPSYTGDFIYTGPTELFAVTATLDYALWANVITRLEVVWDHDLNGSDIFSSQYAVDGESEDYSVVNGRNNSVLLAANIIYKF
ncbi:MAG: outer membrane beta-barrel protein [Verrucomicrobia bacterium]|nr:outer membrane beta-barrel protein [Verrucomicrobiota bacterium]